MTKEQSLWDSFALEDKSLDELMMLSTLIDSGKRKGCEDEDSNNELCVIATKIVDLMKNDDTSAIGTDMYAKINSLIIKRNLEIAEATEGRSLYQRLVRQPKRGTIKISKTRDGYCFTLTAANGQYLAGSETYARIESCLNGVESVKRYVLSGVEDQTTEQIELLPHPKYVLYKDGVGEYRFKLKARNGEVLISSPGYKTPESCYIAIESIKRASSLWTLEKA